MLKIKRDQKREKFLIRSLFVVGIKQSSKAPKIGEAISGNNIN